MINCEKCRTRYNAFDAEVRKMGKKRMSCCPKCGEWVEYAKVAK
jgi:hypothetical protein